MPAVCRETVNWASTVFVYLFVDRSGVTDTLSSQASGKQPKVRAGDLVRNVSVRLAPRCRQTMGKWAVARCVVGRDP